MTDTFASVSGTADYAQALDGACASIWLHGAWRSLTRKMTTEQREAIADAVDRYWAALDAAENEHHEVRAERWWRDDAPLPTAAAPTVLPPSPTNGSTEERRHVPYDNDGVSYCGWNTGADIIDGCGHMWPCPTAQAGQRRLDEAWGIKTGIPSHASSEAATPVGSTPRAGEPEPDDCPHCDPRHGDPNVKPWSVYVGPERDGDGQPMYLHVQPSDGAHVAESDATWLWELIRARPRDRVHTCGDGYGEDGCGPCTDDLYEPLDPPAPGPVTEVQRVTQQRDTARNEVAQLHRDLAHERAQVTYHARTIDGLRLDLGDLRAEVVRLTQERDEARTELDRAKAWIRNWIR